MQGYKFYAAMVPGPTPGALDEVDGHSLIEEFGKVLWNERSAEAERMAKQRRLVRNGHDASPGIRGRIRGLRRS